MSENTEPDLHAKSETSSERVGDVIRKERITRRIALETIAKDLKLNVKYIKALEANEYNALPAEPYIRVYFRSLAKYLMLDPEDILKRFYEERGVPPEVYKKETTTKISITAIENERPFRPWLIITLVIAVLAALSFIANKAGLITTASTDKHPNIAAAGASHADSMAHKAHTDSLAEDSLYGAMIVQHDVPAPVAPPPAKTAAEARQSTDPPAETASKKEAAGADSQKLFLDIRALKDSVWVQVFADGQSSRIYLHANQGRRFSARDSLNVHVGNNADLKYTFNGKPLYIKAKNIAVFKLSRGDPKPDMWTLSKWSSVFKDRL
jgi:cytoskeletal protein RodZ